MDEPASPAATDRIDVPRSPTPRISIIVPATSGRANLLGCLRSLAGPGPGGLPFETIVILNRSTEADAAQLREQVGGVEFCSSPANLGMAGAGNRGRSRARGELLVTLHDDAEVEPGWLAALVQTADAHPEAGAIGSKILGFDGRLQAAGFIIWGNGRTSLPWVGEPPDPAAFARLRTVDFCGSSSLLVRARAWDDVGGLDERLYPAYFVDADLGMGLRKHGWVVMCQPDSRIRHHQSASTNASFRAFLLQRNRQLFAKKWEGELHDHLPMASKSPEGVLQAIAHADARRPSSRCTDARQPAPSGFDDEAQTRRLLAKERELRKEYVDYLGEKLRLQARRRRRDLRYRLLTYLFRIRRMLTRGGRAA